MTSSQQNNLTNLCLTRTNWEAILTAASRVNGDKPCKLLPDCKVGGSSLPCLLEFRDGTRWIARVQLRKSTPETSQRLQNEIDTTVLLKTHTKARVPRVFAFELDDSNLAGSAFLLLEYLPGNTAAEEARDNEEPSWGLIPFKHCHTCYPSMAAAHVSFTFLCLSAITYIGTSLALLPKEEKTRVKHPRSISNRRTDFMQVQIASARLPQIGTVIRNADGSFGVGPIPKIGGPFDSAAAFIQALAASLKFPYEESYLRQVLPPSVIDQVVEGSNEFPSRLASLARSGKHFLQ